MLLVGDPVLFDDLSLSARAKIRMEQANTRSQGVLCAKDWFAKEQYREMEQRNETRLLVSILLLTRDVLEFESERHALTA